MNTNTELHLRSPWLAPEDGEFNVLFGRFMLNMGSIDKAILAFNSVLEIEPAADVSIFLEPTEDVENCPCYQNTGANRNLGEHRLLTLLVYVRQKIGQRVWMSGRKSNKSIPTWPNSYQKLQTVS